MHPNCLWNNLAQLFKGESELDSAVGKSSNTTFKFGEGKSVPSLKKVILPTVVGNSKQILKQMLLMLIFPLQL